MDKRHYVFKLRNEIVKLNKRIDHKILLGYSYEQDAKRHRELLRTVKRLDSRRMKVSNFFGSLFKVGARVHLRPGFTMF